MAARARATRRTDADSTLDAVELFKESKATQKPEVAEEKPFLGRAMIQWDDAIGRFIRFNGVQYWSPTFSIHEGGPKRGDRATIREATQAHIAFDVPNNPAIYSWLAGPALVKTGADRDRENPTALRQSRVKRARDMNKETLVQAYANVLDEAVMWRDRHADVKAERDREVTNAERWKADYSDQSVRVDALNRDITSLKHENELLLEESETHNLAALEANAEAQEAKDRVEALLNALVRLDKDRS